MSRRTLSALAGIVIVVVAALVGGIAKSDHHGGAPSSGISYVEVSALPARARQVLTEIDHGGPFEYPDKDGSVFGNYEGLLPKEPSGYYHEYTVDTPGASTRGTRRIITGHDGELYYTDDHYNSFRRIRR